MKYTLLQRHALDRPIGKDTDIAATLERRLRDATVPFRANSGVANGGTTIVASNVASLNLNTDHRVYIGYMISNAMTTLWLEVSEASPSYISPGFVRDDDVLILSICFKPCVHQHHEPGK
jgi:hypothetical protein